MMRAGDVPHRANRSLWRALECNILGILLSSVQIFAQTDSSQAVQVTTPEEFQEQVRLGTPHIVITEHLNMTDTPRFSESTIMDTGMISIVQAGNGAITQTIRGNCTAQPTETLDPPRKSNTQCVIIVREDFLEVPTEGAQVWISDLYVTLPGVEKMHTTLIGVHGGDVYLTDMSFVGDRDKARAIDVKENRRLYVASSLFTGFQKDRDGVVRLESGAIATFSNSTFETNSVSSGDPETVAAGPVAGLKDDGISQAAAIWFQSCVFRESNEGAVPGDVAVDSRDCRVYSNTFSPTVWDLDLSRQLYPWLLAPREDLTTEETDVFEGREFPTESDGFFERITSEQAAATGLPAVTPSPLPDGTSFITRDPYPSDSKTFWTGRNIALVVGLGGTFIVLAIGVLIWYFCYFKPEGETEPFVSDQKHQLHQTESASAVPAMHASQYGAPSAYGSQPTTESGLHPIALHKQMSSMSSHSSMPHGAYGTAAYGTASSAGHGPYGSHHPAGNNGHAYGQAYGSTYNTFERQSSASDHNSHQGGPPAPYGIPAGHAPYGTQSTPFGPPPGAAYGAGGTPDQVPVPFGTVPPYGAPERQVSNAASSVPPSELAPQQYGSVQDTAVPSAMHTVGAVSSMVTASEPNQSAFSVQPVVQPSVAAAPRNMEPPLAGGAVESTVDDTGIVPPGIDPNWQSNPEAPPTRLDANGRVVLGDAAAADGAAGAGAAPAVSNQGSVPQGMTNHQEGVPHTATFTGLNESATPQRNPGMMNLGDTTDARQGPFSAKAAASSAPDIAGAHAVAGAAFDSNNGAAGHPTTGARALPIDTSTPGASVVGQPAGERKQRETSERETSERDVFLPRVPYNRSATYVFDKTVAPDQDIADITHEKVADMLEDVYAAKALFRGRYETLGSVHQRLGGSGIVQFGEAAHSNVPGEKEVALKFFIKRAAFDRVAGMFATPAIKTSLGAIKDVVSNNEEEKTGGCVLPPCVIMKRGENLEDWAMRLRPNLPTALNALCALADLLKTFHSSGHVYYGFKPANVAWFSEEKKWMLIDFACAARKGMRTGLSFALNYASPEIILAQEAGTRTLAVDPAADIWALGVTAYELLSGGRTFAPGTPTAEIRNMISGRLPLPWEEHEPKQLRTLKHSVMSCLSRNPSERPTAADLHSKWRNLLDFAAVKHTEVST